jgi:hypothetical protein
MNISRNVVAAVGLFALLTSQALAYDDKITHPAYTEAAARTGCSKLDKFLVDDLLLPNGEKHLLSGDAPEDESPTPLGWLRYGALQEDAENVCRAANHFHNPILPWSISGQKDDAFLDPALRLACLTSDYPLGDLKSDITWPTSYFLPAPSIARRETTNRAWGLAVPKVTCIQCGSKEKCTGFAVHGPLSFELTARCPVVECRL